MVKLMDVYDAFLSKVSEDEWAHCYSEEELQTFLQDWRSILNSAIPYFKFPRCSLEIDEEKKVFKDKEMGSEEIQVLSTFMKQEWIKRTVDTWENIKTQYEEKDFSQANLLKTFIALRQQIIEEAQSLERIYYRSVKRRPFNYRRLAGRR
jgi:hypothetical protein